MPDPGSASGYKRRREDEPSSRRTVGTEPASPEEEDSGAEEERRERHYMVRKSDRFDGSRYRVIGQLGKGTFGRVVEMLDVTEDRLVAVKVVRAIEKYTQEAEIEADIIKAVQKTLPRAEGFPIARLLRTCARRHHRSHPALAHRTRRSDATRRPSAPRPGRFESHGHYCLVLDKMGPSLYHVLRRTRKAHEATSSGHKGPPVGAYFSLRQVATIARDCFEALSHLHRIQLRCRRRRRDARVAGSTGATLTATLRAGAAATPT